MKKSTLFMSIFILVFIACQPQKETKPVDIEAEKVAINELLKNVTTAFNNQDVSTLKSLLYEDVFSCGSAPSQFFNKQELTDIWSQLLAQPFELNFIGEPVIKVTPDGLSAFAMHQYYMPVYSSKLAFRNGYHLIKSEDKWLIFAINTACIPRDEDLPKINEALSE